MTLESSCRCNDMMQKKYLENSPKESVDHIEEDLNEASAYCLHTP